MRRLVTLLTLLPCLAVPAHGQLPCHECPGTLVYVDKKAPGPVFDGTSWATAYRHPQPAINNAPNGACIWVARETYFTTSSADQTISFVIGKSLTLLGGFKGDETCLSQRAGLFQRTILSGEIGSSAVQDNSDRVVRIEGPFQFGAGDVVIDGFTISDANNLTLDGGGIYCSMAGSLILRNCWIEDNVAGNGAGVFINGSKLEMLDCTVKSNRAVTDGGGLWASGVTSKLAPGQGAHVYNTKFKSNLVDNQSGGAVYLKGNVPGLEVQFMNCTLSGNFAPVGGAFALEAGGRAKIYNTTITNNLAGVGSAMSAASGTSASFDNSILWNNQNGPGAVVDPGMMVVMSHTVTEDGMIPWECVPTITDCVNEPGCTNWSCDPVFAGGLTLKCANPMSPAIDSGDESTRPRDVFDVDGDNDTAELMPYDKAGDDRVQNGLIDRGAFETCSL